MPLRRKLNCTTFLGLFNQRASKFKFNCRLTIVTSRSNQQQLRRLFEDLKLKKPKFRSISSVSRNLNQSSVAMANANFDQSRAICLPIAYRPKTDGDFKQLVRDLEHYFTLLNIDVACKTTMLLYNLKEKASLTAFHLGLTDASHYDEAKKAFMHYCSAVQTPEEVRTKFHQIF